MYIAPYLVGGLATVLAMDYVPSVTRQVGALPGLFSEAPATQPDRTHKGDREAPALASDAPSEIAVVEVVGLNDVAIVYRDRSGRELYRTDPVNGVTIVTKGLILPEVTVRQTAGSRVTPVPPVPVEARDEPAERKAPAPRPKLPAGCEPSFSPVAAPAMAHHTGRCMAETVAPTRMAALLR